MASDRIVVAPAAGGAESPAQDYPWTVTGARLYVLTPPQQAGLDRLADLLRDTFGLTIRAQRRMEGIVLTITDHRCQLPELCIGHTWNEIATPSPIATWAFKAKWRIADAEAHWRAVQ